MAKDVKCGCGAFLNGMGTCLRCHPKGRERNDNGKKPWSKNNKGKK